MTLDALAVIFSSPQKTEAVITGEPEFVPLQSVPLVDLGVYTIDGILEQHDLTPTVARVLATLTPREEKVLRMRFGIGEKSDYTLAEVGQDFEVGRERIRQIEAKALRKLRHPSRARILEPFRPRGEKPCALSPAEIERREKARRDRDERAIKRADEVWRAWYAKLAGREYVDCGHITPSATSFAAWITPRKIRAARPRSGRSSGFYFVCCEVCRRECDLMRSAPRIYRQHAGRTDTKRFPESLDRPKGWMP